ncbi:hypothetical protein B0O99DRAFT_186310 [Bisporella sp. PMI_857]|nr:hypothetical protein B0O99DRAFT_186310 [Bisporella sp. PMI_857]
MSFTFFLLLASLSGGSALPWGGPLKTSIDTSAGTADWSPAPTKYSELYTDVHGLFKRATAEINTCGWIGSHPALCSTNSKCVWNTQVGYVGCCDLRGRGCDAVYTSCVNPDDPSRTLRRPNVYQCLNSERCYRNTYPGGYYQWGCDPTVKGTTVQTTYKNWVAVAEYVWGPGGGIYEFSTSAKLPTQSTLEPIRSTATTTLIQPTTISEERVSSSAQNIPSTSLIILAPSASVQPTSDSGMASSAMPANPKQPPGGSISSDIQNSAFFAPSSLSSGLSNGAKIGTGVSASVVGLLLIFGIYFCTRGYKQKKAAQPPPPSSIIADPTDAAKKDKVESVTSELPGTAAYNSANVSSATHSPHSDSLIVSHPLHTPPIELSPTSQSYDRTSHPSILTPGSPSSGHSGSPNWEQKFRDSAVLTPPPRHELQVTDPDPNSPAPESEPNFNSPSVSSAISPSPSPAAYDGIESIPELGGS